MLKRKKEMWKQVNKSRLCYDGEKVLTLLAPFFIVQEETVSLNKNIQRGSVCLELIACFELRIELKNLHRNIGFFPLSGEGYSSALQKGGIIMFCLVVMLLNGVKIN